MQNNKAPRYLFTLFLLLLPAGFLFAQHLKEATTDKVHPGELFENGRYHEALDGYLARLAIDGKDPVNAYYAGRCLLEVNGNMDEAIELLYRASRGGAPVDALYYLGLAYHRNYNFQEARKSFEKFSMEVGRQQKKAFPVQELIATCRSAEQISTTYFPYEVSNVTFLELRDSLQYSLIKMKGGELQQKPEMCCSDCECPEELADLMFVPSLTYRGEHVFYAGPSKASKGGTDLYRIQKGTAKSWGKPEVLTDLNSTGNELLPYFDPISENLYFASDGLPGMGGYDLFQSHYDSERDTWSKPQNLGFPVNSVADDVLLLPGNDLGMVLFLSNREGTDTIYTVYRVHFSEPKIKTRANDFRQLKSIAHMDGAANEIMAEYRIGHAPETGPEQKPEVAEKKVKSSDISYLPREEETGKILFEPILSEALSHQASADSLRDLAVEARGLIRSSEDLNDRWVWQKQIVVWERRALEQEGKANELYLEVSEIREINSGKAAVNPPETIEADRTVDGMTVYKYTGTDKEAEPVQKNAAAKTESHVSSVAEPTAKVPKSATNRFEILASSPYDYQHPIPLDTEIPDGVFYRIQLAAVSDVVPPETFGGIAPVTGERIPERDMVKYYAGKFSRYEDAALALTKVRTEGFPDVFIVAWYHGERVSTMRAKQLE